MLGESLLDMVITTVSVILCLALLSCLCCLCMKFSDLKLKCYIVEMANKKGIKVDLDELERKPPDNPHTSPLANETCTIMVPEVGIIL